MSSQRPAASALPFAAAAAAVAAITQPAAALAVATTALALAAATIAQPAAAKPSIAVAATTLAKPAAAEPSVAVAAARDSWWPRQHHVRASIVLRARKCEHPTEHMEHLVVQHRAFGQRVATQPDATQRQVAQSCG